MKRSYLFLAPGFEETEALATVDVMRRAGMEVLTVAINPENSEKVCGAHGVVVVADLLPEDADFTDVEWLICPGGMPGAQNLADSRIVTEALRAHAAKGGKIAAICASPALVLAPLGILDGREATCYPGMQPESDKIVMRGGARQSDHGQRPRIHSRFRACHRPPFVWRCRSPADRQRNARISQIHELLFLIIAQKAIYYR